MPARRRHRRPTLAHALPLDQAADARRFQWELQRRVDAENRAAIALVHAAAARLHRQSPPLGEGGPDKQNGPEVAAPEPFTDADLCGQDRRGRSSDRTR